MEEKKVKDLMLLLEEYATVSSEATIKEAVITLSKAQMGLTYDRHHHRAILALDRNGRVVGKLSHMAILRALEPKLFKEEDLDHFHRAGLSPDVIESIQRNYQFFQGSLQRLCREAARVRVRDAMVPMNESIDEEAVLTEAIQMMVFHHAQSIIVTREGEAIGILRLSDVFEEVADIIRAS